MALDVVVGISHRLNFLLGLSLGLLCGQLGHFLVGHLLIVIRVERVLVHSHHVHTVEIGGLGIVELAEIL